MIHVSALLITPTDPNDSAGNEYNSAHCRHDSCYSEVSRHVATHETRYVSCSKTDVRHEKCVSISISDKESIDLQNGVFQDLKKQNAKGKYIFEVQ